MKQRHLDQLILAVHGLLSMFTVFVYSFSLHYGFLFDDLPTITNNFPVVHNFNPRMLLFAHPRWIPWIFNQLTYKYFGLNPMAYRIGGLCIHLLCAYLVLHLTLRVLRNYKPDRFAKQHAHIIAPLTSGLFLLHPVQSQTAYYITQSRLEGLMVLGILSMVTLFYHGTLCRSSRRAWIWYTGSYVVAALTCGVKEMAIIMPGMMLIFDWFFIAHGNLQSLRSRLLPHTLLWLVVITMYTYLGAGHAISNIAKLNMVIDNNRGNILTAAAGQKIHPLHYMISQFKVIVHYIHMFFWPFNICFDYDWKLAPSFWSFEVLAPLALLLTLGGIALRDVLTRSSTLLAFCIIWFLAAITPRASIVPSTEFVCDYKTYLSSFAAMLFIAYSVARGIAFFIAHNQDAKKHAKHIWIALPALLLAACAVLTVQRGDVWSSRLAFWEDVVKKYPNKPRALNNYAVGLAECNREPEAIIHYKRAMAVDPTYAEPVINLAFHHQAHGEKDAAMQLYKKALTLNEAHPEMFNNLGSLHLMDGRHAQAQQCFNIALGLRPHYGKALVNLARSYQQQGKLNDAWSVATRMIKSDFRGIEVDYTYGEIAFKRGEYETAESALKRVFAVFQQYQETPFLLGSCYYNKGDYKQACELFSIAHNVRPHVIAYAYNYAQALFNTGKFEQAARVFKVCNPAIQTLPYAALRRADCLIRTGNSHEARTILTSFIKTTQHERIKKEAQTLLASIPHG